MKKTTHAEDTLFSATHPQLYKKISSRQVFLAFIVALCGFVMISFSALLGKSNDTLSMVLLTIGVIMAIVSVYHFFAKRYETVYSPTGSVVQSGSLYMDTVELQHVRLLIEKNNFANAPRISFKDGGNGRLDYLVAKDGKFVAIQLFQFVPYTFEPISDKCYYTNEEATAVVRCMNI